tara:strand:+ start:232 stop:570 length:339 start_codon:yes stop_codon:yes gene_type:complete
MSQEKKKNKVTINGKPVLVSNRRLTFYHIQAVAPLMMHGSLDFSDYWRHAFSHWLHYSDPDGRSIEIDIDDLSPQDGAKLSALLPEPSQVMDWLVFREAKSDSSSSSSTGGQ